MTPSDIFATALVARLPESRQRWRRADLSVLSGEVAAIARSDAKTAWLAGSAGPLAVVVREYADHPDWFSKAEESRRYRAGLGRLIKARVTKLTDPDGKADTMLKLWSRSSQEQFVSLHLPKILRQVAKSSGSTVELGALIAIVANWDRDNNDIIRTAAEEFFAAPTKKAESA